MGSGASANKTAVQPFQDDGKTARTNGVSNDPVELRKDLVTREKEVKAVENRCSELTEEVARLNRLVAELEGQKLDLEDRLSSQESELRMYNDGTSSEKYEETMKAKDQMIANLEAQIRTQEVNAKKARAGWRRKLRSYATQLAEEKQASAIRVMELRQEVNRLHDVNEKLKSGQLEPGAGDAPKDSLIMELSEKLMEQTQAVERMEVSIRAKDEQLERLESASSQRSNPRKPRRDTREWSGVSHDSGLDSDAAPDSASKARKRPESASLSPLSEREAAMVRGQESPDIAEDCNWDAASLDADSEDTIGASPRLLAIAARQQRCRSIILDPDKAQTIDSLLDAS